MNTTKLLSIATAVIGTSLLGFLGYRKMSSEYKKDEEIEDFAKKQLELYDKFK